MFIGQARSPVDAFHVNPGCCPVDPGIPGRLPVHQASDCAKNHGDVIAWQVTSLFSAAIIISFLVTASLQSRHGISNAFLPSG